MMDRKTIERISTECIRWCLSFLLLVSISSFLVCDARAESLRIGIYQNSPKIFTDETGNPSGFFPTLTDAVEAIGASAEYVLCEWANCLEMLAQGEIDIMPDVAWSEERAMTMVGSEAVIQSWSQYMSGTE